MEKFKDIKVGDTVYLTVDVNYAWNRYETFTVPKQVERVTKTQFIIGERRFKKDSGREVGQYGYAYNLGDKIPFFIGFVKDQTEEMDFFMKKIKLEVSIKRFLASIQIKPNSDLSVQDLMFIKEHLKEVKSVIDRPNLTTID